VPQRFFTKFPRKINRVQLSDNRDRNRVNSEIQSRYQKRLFLTYFSPQLCRSEQIAGRGQGRVERDQVADTLRPGAGSADRSATAGAQFKATSQLSVRKLLYGCLGLSHNPALLNNMTSGSRWYRRHAGRRTACDQRDRQRDARSCEWPPGFESSASASLKLVAVSADQIFLAVCTAFVAAVKRHTLKHSKEVTRKFQSTIGKHW
jgi:hypothetical protein